MTDYSTFSTSSDARYRDSSQDSQEEVLEAELLSNNQGSIYKINNEIHINPAGRVILPDENGCGVRLLR